MILTKLVKLKFISESLLNENVRLRIFKNKLKKAVYT